MMIWMLFLRFIVPVLGVFYGTSLIADEVEDKTITYLFTRPIPRGAVLVGKYLAYLVCTVLVVLPSVMVVYFLIVPIGGVPASFLSLVLDLGCWRWAWRPTALSSRSWVRGSSAAGIGLGFAFGWEQSPCSCPATCGGSRLPTTCRRSCPTPCRATAP